MHTAEETASLLASLAPFSLFPTSEDDDARRGVTLLASGDGQYCRQQGKGVGKLDKFNADIMAGST